MTLIALRLLIGFHFLNEGLDKLLHPKPFTAAFLENAKGPFAPALRAKVWDVDGLARLGYQPSEGERGFPTIDVSATREQWDGFRQRVVAYYGFDEEQVKAADKVLQSYDKLLTDYVKDYEPDLVEYFQGIERRNRYRDEAWRDEVSSLRGQLADIEAKLKATRGRFLSEIDAMWRGLERDLNAIASPEQSRRPLEIGRLQAAPLDSVALDRFVPWFDISIGVCLITGLLVRFAGALAAAFLAMVVASQWPGSPGAVPTWYQAIEMVAIVHLVVIGAGNWGGLDGLIRKWRGKCCSPKQGSKK